MNPLGHDNNASGRCDILQNFFVGLLLTLFKKVLTLFELMLTPRASGKTNSWSLYFPRAAGETDFCLLQTPPAAGKTLFWALSLPGRSGETLFWSV